MLSEINVTAPHYVKETYHTGSQLLTMASATVLCPLGHKAGTWRKQANLGGENRDLYYLNYNCGFSCPACGVHFGLTEDDVEQLTEALNALLGGMS